MDRKNHMTQQDDVVGGAEIRVEFGYGCEKRKVMLRSVCNSKPYIFDLSLFNSTWIKWLAN